MEHRFPSGAALKLVQGDITKIAVDAMVNAANSALAGGGGVDGAIHRAGGPTIMRELDAIRKQTGGCPTGTAVATGAGNLPAKWIFHTAGPVYRDGKHGEPKLLAACYSSCLRLSDERGVEVISFPAISAGVYGYPMREAAQIAIGTVSDYLNRGGGSVREALFVLFGESAFQEYSRVLGASS
jgi:O-acetyl-ADP-ribose deacetylase